MHVSYHNPCLPICSVVCQSSNMRLCRCTRRFLRHRPPLRHPSPRVVSTVCSSGAVEAAATTTTLSHLGTEAHGPQGKRWDKVQRWVMFSDLHVSVRTLDTCISVLQKIKKEATSRKAGILFLGENIVPKCYIACIMIRVKHQRPSNPICCKVCHIPCRQHSCTPAPLKWAQRRSAHITGDFWHARGALPVEPLNAILREFESWRQPTLMLVGNHDQVSVGGLDHALQPLAAACSAIHIVDAPTLYR